MRNLEVMAHIEIHYIVEVTIKVRVSASLGQGYTNGEW
jgi:hypothetical protein